MKAKTCSKCGMRKPINMFYKGSISANYKDGYHSECMECMKNRQARLAKTIRLAVIELLGSKCVRCGFDDIRALQVDHINGGGNKERLSFSGNGVLRKILREGVDGYQLLCANCNAIKVLEQREHYKGRHEDAD